MIPNCIQAQLEHQKLVSDQISKAIEDLYKGGKERISRRRLDARLSALHEDWQEFSSNHKSLSADVAELPDVVRSEVKGNPYFTLNLFRTTRETFLESFEKMTTLLDEIQDASIAGGSSQTPHSQPTAPLYHRLPHLDLPKFNGDYTEWLTFRDIFSSIVLQNDSLSPVEKLYYLRSNLTGSAALLLNHTPLTGDNFQKAWNDLTSFYDNKRILIDSTLHSLFSIKCIQKESATELEELYTTLQQNIRSLEILGQPVQHWDAILIYIATRCLDPNTIRAWELELGSSTEYPKWSQLGNFLVRRMRSLQAIARTSSVKPPNQTQISTKSPSSWFGNRPSRSHSIQQSSPLNPSSRLCFICENDHLTYRCPEYVSKPTERKVDILKQRKLCFNCLGPHAVKSCPSVKRCLKCGQRHHTSIHGSTPTPRYHPSDNLLSNPTYDSDSTTKQVTHIKSSSLPLHTSVLLATAQAKIELDDGQLIDVRILIDPCSEISLVTEHLVQSYHIPRCKSYLSVVGVGAQSPGRSKGSISIKLKSNYDPDYFCIMSAEILPRLTGQIPSIPVSSQSWPHLRDLELADPSFSEPSPVDLLLGADFYPQIIRPGLKTGQKNSPIAQLTSLGWILSGPTGQPSSVKPVQGYHCACERDWYGLIEAFWRQEEIIDRTPSMSPAEEDCEHHFTSTHTRLDSGKYQVRLPFKGSVASLGDSKVSALKALHQMGRRFATNPALFREYDQFLKDYEELGHMQRVPSYVPEPSPVNYIPHHPVLSPNNKKLRVVFNGSSKVANGTPINDLLHVGAKLQTDLVDVLLYFRKFRHVFSTDVEKMYRQVLVHPDDWSYQRILWKNSIGEVILYNLTTVTYGLACSPFLALRAVQQLVEDEGKKFPLAVPVLVKGRYVDDTFGKSDTVEEGQQIVQQVTKLCMAGGFPLRKWVSNHPELLNSIPDEHKLPVESVSIQKPTSIPALGLSWQLSADLFIFSSGSFEAAPFTKRSISSKIARLFDPLGFISPIVIRAKIILQKLWAVGVGWDDPIPAEMIQEWVEFTRQLSDLPLLRFPRWMGITENCSLQVHGFSDASRVGIAAVVYVRISLNDHITVSLVCAKTKVTPLKQLTIPRLELSAAALLTQLTAHVRQTLDLHNPSIFLWTDSAIVHTWINSHPSKWKEYVHNRVCLIQETLPLAQWRFIPGQDNPADCASRGLTPIELSTHSSWWNGPSWLTLDSTHWPCSSPAKPVGQLLETKPTRVVNVTRTPTSNLWDLIGRYSDLTRLLRITATCFRVIKKFRQRLDAPLITPLTPE